MKRIIMLATIVIFGIGVLRNKAEAQSRQQYSMDFGWQFTLGDPDHAEQPGFDDSGWRTLNVPHDWSIEGAFDRDAPGGGNVGFLPTGVGWYRKHFTAPTGSRGKNIWLQFDGIYMNSDVWINGRHLGHRPYGFISFQYDVSSYLQPGENVIAVRVDNSLQPNARWYTGSGIYRHVRLVVADPLHIDHWGVAITTPVVTSDSGIVAVETRITNERSQDAEGALVAVLADSGGREVALTETPFEIAAGTEISLRQRLRVEHPELWSVDHPNLYSLQTTIQSGGNEVDAVSTPVGIRSIRYDADRGFFLNGKHVKMHGVNLHSGGGAVGAAVPAGVWGRRLKILKSMGVNAIRTAHNPPAPEFLDLCDRLGLLVMDEAFDEWTAGKRKYGYHLYFDEWSKRDLTAMILRDRNHPSVVLWSAGNEIGDQSMVSGVGVLEQLMGVFHQLDPSRPVTTGNDRIADTRAPTTKKFLEALDIVGYNYADRWGERRELFYTPDKLAHPGWKMIGTESSNIHGMRGSYSLGPALDTLRPNYNFNMIRVEQLWKFVATHDYVIGDFMWTGIDYLGEARWPAKNASSGSLDLAGFKKDSYYFYRSQWTDEPVLHLFPHWNWPGREGQVIPVLVYTNCDAVELYLNGKSLGEKRQEFPRQGTAGGWNSYARPRVRPTTADLHLEWDVPYEPGVLKAVGKKAGKIILTREVRTSGPPAALRLDVDQSELAADGEDVAHVTVEVVDTDGNPVPDAGDLIRFDLQGAGRIIGVENGDPMDHDSPKGNRRRAFHGRCLAIIQSTRVPGAIQVQVSAEGLKGGTVHLTTRAAEAALPVLE